MLRCFTNQSISNSFNKLRVAYNDALRQLLQEPLRCSASSVFAFNGVSSLSVLMRKLFFFHSDARYKLQFLLPQICTFSRLFLSVGAVFFSNLFIVPG